MFLTHVPLNTGRRSAVALLSSPHRIHAAIQSGFTDTRAVRSVQPATDGRVLWRVDRNGADTNLYVVSPDRPDFASLMEQAGWTDASRPVRTADYSPFLQHLEAGQEWAFRLTANPVTTTLDALRGRKVRVPHVTVAQQTKWFTDRAEASGFSVPAVLVDDRRKLEFQRSGKKVTLASVSYRGTLKVVDPGLLRSLLTNGIGKAKGYGFGLMTLAKPA